MTQPGTSLKKYRDAAIQDQNPTKAKLTYGKDNPLGWNAQNIVNFNSSTGTPTIDWNGYSSRDPIVWGNLGCYSTSTSCSEADTPWYMKIMQWTSVLTAGFGIAKSGVDIYNQIKSNKSDDKSEFSKKEQKTIDKNTANTQSVSVALDSAIDAGNMIEENNITDTETIQKANSSLMSQVNLATTAKNEANQNISSAETTKGNLTKSLTQAAIEKGQIEGDIASLEREISNLEKQDKLTDEQKTTLKNKKEQLKNKKEALEKKEEEIERINRDIKVQDEIIAQNNAIVNDLSEKIETGNKLIKKLNNQLPQQ